jgi:hypothetical protein
VPPHNEAAVAILTLAAASVYAGVDYTPADDATSDSTEWVDNNIKWTAQAVCEVVCDASNGHLPLPQRMAGGGYRLKVDADPLCHGQVRWWLYSPHGDCMTQSEQVFAHFAAAAAEKCSGDDEPIDPSSSGPAEAVFTRLVQAREGKYVRKEALPGGYTLSTYTKGRLRLMKPDGNPLSSMALVEAHFSTAETVTVGGRTAERVHKRKLGGADASPGHTGAAPAEAIEPIVIESGPMVTIGAGPVPAEVEAQAH